jgi:chromosomal replication initiator protein
VTLHGCPTIDRIQREVCAYFGITRLTLLAHRRPADEVHYRQVAMYLAKILTVQSLPEIGRRFNKRDHTTVLHACRKIEKERKASADLDSTITALKELILTKQV